MTLEFYSSQKERGKLVENSGFYFEILYAASISFITFN